MNKPSTQSRNPEIDGWRGISILMVIISHLMGNRYGITTHFTPLHSIRSLVPIEVVENVFFRLFIPFGSLGVSLFFVISGYLITTILLREEALYGSISIRAFYARRMFRIVPALSVFLMFNVVLNVIGVIHIPWLEFLWVGAFLADTRLHDSAGTWWLGHCWSLSVEEQFYLIWPLAFTLLQRRPRARWLGVAYILLVCSSYVPSLSSIWIGWGGARLILGLAFPCIVLGAAYACSEDAVRIVNRLAKGSRLLIAFGLLLLQGFYSNLPIVEFFMRPFIPLLIAFVFFGSLSKRSRLSDALSARWLSGIGLISYSLYLWQESFTAYDSAKSAVLRWTILCLPIAAISYFVIEKPMIRVGHRISREIIASRFARREPQTATSRNGDLVAALEPSSEQ